MSFTLKSKAFSNEGVIPAKYTCDGDDVSPPLAWSGAPEGTRSYALIVDDPDAPVGTWVHWVVWNIPVDTTHLDEGMAHTAEMPTGMRQGMTDFKRPGYGGPCPPGGIHRYYFKLYALDKDLDVPSTATKADLVDAMKGHVLGEATYMGRYSRS